MGTQWHLLDAGRAADWWSAGIVMYKLMTGRVPFRGKSKQLLRERIISSPLKWPRPEDHPNSATTPGKDMTYRMLKKNPVDRLGSKNYSDLKTHPFFDQFNWQMLYKKELCNIPSIAEILHNGAGIGHSGCLVCELPEDDKHAILTPGVPPERRIEDHEGVEGKESLPAEKVDIVLYRNKKYFKFSDFGFTLRRVRGEEANFIYVDAVTKGSPADVAKVLPLDVLMNVNGVPVGETPLAQINKIISSVGEQLAISVMASSPYRLLTSRRDMLGIMRSIPRESAVVKAAPGSSTGGKTYGVTILDVDVTDEKLKRSSKCFMLLRADVASCNNKMVFPGDVVFEINGTSVDGMSRPQVDQLLNTGKPEVTLCVVPLSPMRKNRYLISKLLETGGTDINVPSKSTGATIG
ncbi:hypothetical protein HPB52_014595 [Rhipicephalus sanguineus]|uniref:Serine/threonine protein kinase n=1 Tax=Rhipicephalus sanguineus TaxID=34632 RepID=A0A9D4YQ81_RHISA|nr:hypothetical protein HPB52_014595 [Rhipicephalus sanguineus]